MEMSVQEVSMHLNHSLKIAKEEIQQQAEAMLTDQKRLASEEAVNSIKKDDRQEFTDYQWLKKEVKNAFLFYLRANIFFLIDSAFLVNFIQLA